VIRLAKLIRPDGGRYALGCVRVLDPGDGTYRCEATDSRVLGIVRGASLEAHYPAVEDAPKGIQEALVSGKDWTNAFRLHGRKDIIGLALGPADAEGDAPPVCRFASDTAAYTCAASDGHYPTVDQVLPRRPPLVTFTLDAAALAKLLDVVQALADDDEHRAVTFHYYGRAKVLGLSSRNSQGQFFDGLIVPLS
jgi:hypothetical protein